MGLLQKLLGRRDEEPAQPAARDDAPARAVPTAEPATSAAPPPAATDTTGTSSVLGDAAPLPEPVPPTPVPATEPPSDEPDPEPVDLPQPATGDDSDSGSADDTETETVIDTTQASATDTDYFVPERPRRELLTLDPPAPPAPEEAPRQPGVTLPLDVSGSPRAALRGAGITVPHMQQIVQRGDVRLWAFGVRADEALGWWLQARQVHDRTGWLPVLLGAADDWLDNGEGVLHEGEDELGRMAELDVMNLLAEKAAEAGEPPRGVPILPTRGDSDFAVPKSDGLMGLIEAEHSWQIPALLPWKGSTNWELYGAEHATVLERWHERYEVEVVSMTWDILELYVPNPPSNDDDVLEAAQEVYAYCPDLLAAGVPTLDDLAVHMVRSRAWYFRWN